MIKPQDQGKIIKCLAAALTYGIENNYSYNAIEERICSSNFINNLENGEFIYDTSYEKVINDIYQVIDKVGDITFKCLFIAESYFKLFLSVNRSFQYLFLYMPLSTMVKKYNIYHEMDFSSLLNDFEIETSKVTLFKKICSLRNIKHKEVSSLTGININTINRYSKKDEYLFSASFENIYKLSKLFKVKENLFISNLAIYLDESIYHFDKTNIMYRSYLGLYFTSYFDSRIKEDDFIYKKEEQIFYSKKEDLNIKILIQDNEELSVDEINKKSNKNTYIVLFVFTHYYRNLDDYSYLKLSKCLDLMVITQENIFIIKKNIKREITDTINRSLIMKAKLK